MDWAVLLCSLCDGCCGYRGPGWCPWWEFQGPISAHTEKRFLPVAQEGVCRSEPPVFTGVQQPLHVGEGRLRSEGLKSKFLQPLQASVSLSVKRGYDYPAAG